MLKIVLRSYFNVAQTQCIYNKNTLYFQLEFLSGEDTADALAKLKRFIWTEFYLKLLKGPASSVLMTEPLKSSVPQRKT